MSEGTTKDAYTQVGSILNDKFIYLLYHPKGHAELYREDSGKIAEEQLRCRESFNRRVCFLLRNTNICFGSI